MIATAPATKTPNGYPVVPDVINSQLAIAGDFLGSSSLTGCLSAKYYLVGSTIPTELGLETHLNDLDLTLIVN